MWRRNLFLLHRKRSLIRSSVLITTGDCNPFLRSNHRSYHIIRTVHLNLNITSTLQSSWKKYLHEVRHCVKKSSDEFNCNSFTYRTHTCGELRPEHVEQKVTLCGWVQYQRLSKFLLLRDAYGLTQCMVGKDEDLPVIPLETIVKIEGTVALRPKEMINAKMPTGEVEVVISNFKVLNNVDKLPFNLRDYQKPKEQLRMQYRYVDLRFPEMQANLRHRSTLLHNMRRFLVEKHGFVEVETPTLFCRTPGGAREFVVPTHHAGLFYSLVQSPQQFKQMLMSGGVDRYFQVARCYRDEATRPDRQPEFTQLDIELSFTNFDGVLSLVEQLMHETFLKDIPKPPFKRITYKEAIQNYGTDKPNLSHGLSFKNLTHILNKKDKDSSFGAYAVPYPKVIGKLTAKYKETIRDLTKRYKNKIILYENISKEFGTEVFDRIQNEIGSSNACIISLGEDESSCLCLGEIRNMLVAVLKAKNLLQTSSMDVLWVVDFPLFVNGVNGLETCHHPFTAPHPDDAHLLQSEPLKVRSLAYDLVLNGNEIGGGSVRVHDAALQEELLGILHIDSQKLAHFMNALKCGCPPHAGIALGIDRIVTLACNAESIRDVIAFPKSHDGSDPLSGAPNSISEEDKKYYHIKTVDCV